MGALTSVRALVWRHLHKVAIRALRRFNPGDISIRHHYTGERIRIHSFMHKGYWYHGKRREQQSMELFAKLIQPGDRVVEIGGHVGYITLYFASLVGADGKVTVFEPGPNNLPYIGRNVGAKTNIELVAKAVADFSGTASFYVENLTGQNNSLLPDYWRFDNNLRNSGLQAAVAKSVVQVDCVTLDEFLDLRSRPAPAFIKIDVEGAEFTVLRGMSKTLSAGNVALMVEITDRAPAVYELLTAAGFTAFAGRNRPVRSAGEVHQNTFWLKPDDPRMRVFTGN